MDPLRTYDYLFRSRGRVLDWAISLDAEQYARVFAIGPGTVGKTLTHIMISEWYYVQRMAGREVPPYAQWPIKDEDPPPADALRSYWTDQAKKTRGMLVAVRDWNATIEYSPADVDPPIIVTASANDLYAQLVLHEAHHRAQVLHMFKQLGVPIEDIDFNAMMMPRRILAD